MFHRTCTCIQYMYAMKPQTLSKITKDFIKQSLFGQFIQKVNENWSQGRIFNAPPRYQIHLASSMFKNEHKCIFYNLLQANKLCLELTRLTKLRVNRIIVNSDAPIKNL